MKTQFYKTILTTLTLASATLLLHAATYTISSNTNWSSKIPATCANCTIIISGNATLTVNEAVTCQNCTFIGGTVAMTNQTLNLQYSGAVTTTSFIGTDLVASGTSKVVANAPVSVTGGTFTFDNTASFTTSYDLSLLASKVNLDGNSTMTSTGGAGTTIDLVGNSVIAIGDGSNTSASKYTVSGPTLNVVDNSSVSVGNNNNVFYDWSNYNGSSSSGGAKKSISTSSSTMNCGTGYAHACSNPSLYGPVALTKSGVIPGSPLPVVLVGFSAELNSNKTVTLDWNTMQEVNAKDFVIERSADGSVWSEIGTVAAKGNSATESFYSFTDEMPAAGINYYRLRMVDLDNRYGYTDVKVVRFASVVSSVSFFPNPARDYVNVSLGQGSTKELTIRLVSLSGQVLQEKKASAGGIVSFPVQQYPAGLYILIVNGADGLMESSKLMISRS